jgi:hypothetical protein
MSNPCSDVIIDKLEKRYQEILGSFELPKIYSDDRLSGIFLAKPDKSFFESDRKVIIIGQETRGWRNKECRIKNGFNTDIESIRDAMDFSLIFNREKPKTSRFRQFYKKASSYLDSGTGDAYNSAIWSNQFCMSYKGKSPRKSKCFEGIRNLSSQLLQAQFEILKPDIAIFTVGSGRDVFIKETFKHKTVKVITPRRLWHFKVDHTHCFRTNHPRWFGSSKYLNKALELSITQTK